MDWGYIAGVFDPRGFIRIDNKNKIYAVFFNFTEPEKEVFTKLQKELNLAGIRATIYKTRKKGKYQEYMLYIGGVDNVVHFLKKIKPYSARHFEINEALKLMMSKQHEKKRSSPRNKKNKKKL